MPFSIVPLPSGATRISLEGDLDGCTLARLRPELVNVIRRRPAAVEVDLSRLRSLDARGVQILGAFFADLARTECQITVTEMREQPSRSHNRLLFDVISNGSRVVN